MIKHSFAEVLRQMYPAEDLGTRLLDLFLSDSQNTAPQSVSRKIRNWLAGKNEPADREDIFRIAFAQRTPGTPLVFDMHSRKFILSQTYAYLEWGILEDLTSVNCTSYFMTVP